MRPITSALTCNAWPIFCGSSSLPLNLKTVLRAITLRAGNCESVLIRLSVRPSLKYSLPESAVALTKGSTAMDVIFWESDLPRHQKNAAAAAIARTATIAKARALCERTGEATAGTDAALEDDMALASAALAERPESRSRLRRARSERRSAALW